MPDDPELEVEVLEEPTVPAERTPKNTREFFLRPPDWRFQAARKYLHDERHGRVPMIPTDPFVQFGIRILRALNDDYIKEYISALAPYVWEVMDLGYWHRDSSLTGILETNLIWGITAEDADAENFCIAAPTYELYSKLFCDLSGIQAVHAWVNDFLFEPERHSKNTTLLRARLLAYYRGKEAGEAACVTGMSDQGALDMMKEISKNEQQKRIFDYIVRATDMRPEDYVAVMESAVKSMTEKDFQEHMRDRDEAGSSSLGEMAEHLEEGIRAYSQKELEAFNQNGLDFVNQYIPVIIRKDSTDDGK